ncbi:Golgi phosphoprotein 3 (GPP34) [Blastococcus aurantiacus]|uniref:Golgi phosphoprotein 3 (GPP34) n=1 Tax=Blastococcus aurantiacus TaxID=1550231 RepID=A0A1G7JXL4_9ACTN|nr:GPP34 family phosphoprotein [Blastococcus aurantiacus]SDF29686.1 Golgi phosphoprotein 3 (GPP34) [Blastococcus aurantiacus]
MRDLVATRVASLCLSRRGRPRGLTYDDHLVRGALILDLALRGALTHTADAVELDHDRAGAHGLADVAAEVDEGDTGLQWWLDHGRLDFEALRVRLVEAGVWRLRPWSLRYPFRSFEDTERARTEADRATGRQPARDGGAGSETLAVWALGATSGLFGAVEDPPPWVLEDLGDARWAAELVVERLTELRIRMRSIGHAVD